MVSLDTRTFVNGAKDGLYFAVGDGIAELIAKYIPQAQSGLGKDAYRILMYAVYTLLAENTTGEAARFFYVSGLGQFGLALIDIVKQLMGNANLSLAKAKFLQPQQPVQPQPQVVYPKAQVLNRPAPVY